VLLTVRDATKKFQNGAEDFLAVHKASFEVHEQEICVIVGQSGSGKSTLLNMIGGLEQVTSGEILFEGDPVSRKNSRELNEYRRRNIGFVFQFYNLVPNLTARENIEVCRHLSSDPFDLDALMQTVGVAQQRDRYPSQLSGGQQQRVAIARALVKKPRLLLCDEPTGALDYQTSRSILELFEKVNEEYRITIMMVTHNEALRAMADRVLTMKDGAVRVNTRTERRRPAAQITW